MIEIDGSIGEGGGQVLRTSLALAALLNKPLRIRNIRKNRSRPGLKPQHLAGVKALAAICRAGLEGAEIGSAELSLQPHSMEPGEYSFAIGTAGAATLLLQTLLPVLIFADAPSSVRVSGGTHVPWSPSFHYFNEIFLPMLGRLGVHCRATNRRCGFYPQGGGEITLEVEPVRILAPLFCSAVPPLSRITGMSGVARLPLSIAERQRSSALKLLAGKQLAAEIALATVAAKSPGTFIFLKSEQGEWPAGFTGLGARGKSAELVGQEAGQDLLQHLAAQACLDPHLADQLVVYLALAHGSSSFTTSRLSTHLLTNLQVVEQILGCFCQVRGEVDKPGEVVIHGVGFPGRD